MLILMCSVGLVLCPLQAGAAIFDDILQVQATDQERESTAFYIDGTYEID